MVVLDLRDDTNKLLATIQNKRKEYHLRKIDDDYILQAALKVYLDNTGLWK